MIVRSERKRINQVITNARMYLYMQPWTPLRDEHAFKSANPAHTFHSAFRIAAGKQLDATCSARYYEVMPYVFGGSDSITKFQNRIYNRTCPGGWDRISANTTSHWYSGLGYGARVPGNLAGIDCSAYVSNCWQITYIENKPN